MSTDAGRGRAWLRSALNEHSLEKYMHMFIEDSSIIRYISLFIINLIQYTEFTHISCLVYVSICFSQFYEDWSFLMDQEKNSMLPNMAAGWNGIV